MPIYPNQRVWLVYTTYGNRVRPEFWSNFNEYAEEAQNRTMAHPLGQGENPSLPWSGPYTNGAVLASTTAGDGARLRQIQEFNRANPTVPVPDAWHSEALPEGLAWVGRYFVAQVVNGRWQACEAGDEYPSGVKTYDCWHCAEVVRRGLIAAGTASSQITVASWLDDSGLASFMPPAPEIIGGAVSERGDTTRPSEAQFSACSKCGRVGHNVRTCRNDDGQIDRVGIEIEGRWRDLDATERRAGRAGMSGCGDGSVRSSSTARAYEFQTKPGSCAQALNQLYDFYPDESDASCGMHVHVSFKYTTAVTLLYSQEFFDYFRVRWEAWGIKMQLHPRGEFFSRLRGENDYCRPNVMRTAMSNSRRSGNTVLCSQESITDNDRYAQLNFIAWDEHKTVECRLLPMFRDAGLGIAAVCELVDIYETWLSAAGASVPLPSAKHAVRVVDGIQKHHASFAAPELPPFVLGLHSEVKVDELPPVEPGMTRRVLSPDDLETVRRLLRIAA